MNTIKTTSKAGTDLYLAVYDAEFEALISDGCHGLCIACGNEVEGVEPDARRYPCDECKRPKVFGLEELAIMGLVRPNPYAVVTRHDDMEGAE